MQRRIAVLTILVLTIAAVTTAVFAQEDKSNRPSPPAQALCKFDNGKTITVDYSSPRMKGRKIFGGLEAYGKVWRAGANEATTFVTDGNLTVEGKAIPAGNYTIFAIPDPNKWTLIINKKTGEWGIPYTYEADELVRVPMKTSKTPAPVENFAIGFDQHDQTCTLHLTWENTDASVLIRGK
jgi:hypothetical protein